jgi:uncharacterized protein YlaI
MNKKISRITSMSVNDFSLIVKSSESVCDILSKLGYSKNSGSMHKLVKNKIIDNNIEYSHFRISGNKGGQPKYSLDEILIKDSKYTNIARLKNRLINNNLLEYICDMCGNKGIWNGKMLSLQLDHINGINNDHRISNLRFLCPNCHSQTDTYCSKNINKYK